MIGLIILMLASSCFGVVGIVDEDVCYVQFPNSMSMSNLSIRGSLVFENTVWDDMTVSAMQLNTGAGAPASIVYLNGIKQISYNSGDSSFGQIQFSHSKKRGTDVHPHIHWSSIDDRSSITNIRWTLTANYGDVMSTLTNYYSNTVVVTGTNAYLHKLSSFPPFGSNVLNESSIVMFEIACTEDGGTNDKVFLHDIDFHFQIDKLGSAEEIPE